MKKKNAGFTLVELIIAVVILAIAVGPLFYNFIISSRTNYKSRKQLNAMNLAQDVMEGMSQYSQTDLDKYFSLADVSANTLVATRILPDGTTYTPCTVTQTPTPSDPSTVYVIEDVQTTTGNLNKYDLTVTVTPTSNANYQNKELADVATIDQYYDAIYTINASGYSNAVADLKLKSSKPALADSTYEGKIKREIVIKIQNEKANASATDDFTVNVDATYSPASATDASTLGLATTDTSVKASGNISKTAQTILPRAVYLYFEGMPGATTSNDLDVIKVENTTGQKIDVYIIRNIDASTMNEQSSILYNKNYGCDLYVSTYTQQGATVTFDENVDIISNLRYYLLSSSEYKNGVRDTSNDRGTGTESTHTDQFAGYNWSRGNYYYNSTTNKITEDVYQAHFCDGYKKATKNSLYDIKLEIREAGKTEVLSTYTGGTND